ncbi:MAG TPA: ABC transporter permease [Actinomycetota bacterium]|nr:ABC transporter permease [Actinomycetota bacterium]
MLAKLTGNSEAAEPPRRKLLDGWAVLAIPGVVFLTLFFVLPVFRMGARSFTDPGPENYLVFVESSVYARVLWTTIRISLLVTVICIALGYPYAYAMNHSGNRLRALLAALVLVPFWSSLLVRTYAWTVLLGDTGVINSLLLRLGVIEHPVALMRNTLGVTIGMSHILLPFMVLPVFAAMRRIDADLIPAAKGLGASAARAFLRVFMPLSLPGVAAGCLLVFVLSLGFYITPSLLGNPRNAMFSELVVNMVTERLQFGTGSALAITLLAVTLILLWVGSRFVRISEAFGPAQD